VKTKNLLFFAIVALALFSFTYAANSITPFRGFVMTLPDQINAQPGDTIIVNGSLMNIGYYWLHDFNLTYSGLPTDFQVSFTPQHWESLMTIRAWDPVNGLYKVPVPFNMTIKIPATAAGAYAINITGQEFQSWKQIQNSSVFVLKVGGVANVTPVSVQGTISVSELIVPETIQEFQPFNVTFNLVNSGDKSQTANISLQAPADWTVTAQQSVDVPANNSVPIVFTVIPTATSGNLAVVLEYPYQQTILNITKAGPYLIPSTNETQVSQVLPSGLISFIQENTVLTIIIAIVVLILIWYFVSTYSFYSKRKKPEQMKKQVETEKIANPEKIETISQEEAIKPSPENVQ
jgi:cell division protein FtsL